jgi:hypothetical protein
VPIPKPGKPVNDSLSFRPISLLSPVIKVLEKLILPYLRESLPCASSQQAYRPFHSTTTALLPIATKIAIGFNQPACRTAMVNLDIYKAFDVVSHDLLEMISDSALHSNLVRWLKTYITITITIQYVAQFHMRGRTAACLFQGAMSAIMKCHSGTPQGRVLSPQLWNYYVRQRPNEAEEDDSYADDFGLCESSPNVDVLGVRLTGALSHVSR